MSGKAAAGKRTAEAIRIGVIEDLSQLEPLREEWNRVVERSAFDSVFATYELFSSWARNFLGGNAPLIVLAYAGEELAGVLPLMLETRKMFGLEITLIRSMTNSHNCKYDFVLERRRARQIMRQAMAYLCEHYDWDFMRLDYMPDDSRSLAVLREMEKEEGCRVMTSPILESPFVRISGSWDEYVRRLDGNFRRNIRQYERRLDRWGIVQLERVSGPADLERHIREALAIEKSGWKGTAGTAIADSESQTRYYLDLAASMSRRGWFVLYFLSVNGKKVAFDYCLQYKDRMNMLKTSYDPEYAKGSPGKVLRAKAMAELFQDRFRIYDLLGSRDEWKMKWTPHCQKLSSVLVFNRKAFPTAAFVALSARDGLKSRLRSFPAVHRLIRRAVQTFRRGA